MIPTLPGTSDIPEGPERPQPVRVLPPTISRTPRDDLEELKRTVERLRARLEDLEARVARLDGGSRGV